MRTISCNCGKCPACKRRKYRAEHPDKYAEEKKQIAAYRKAHPEKARAWAKAWRERNPEKKKAQIKRYFEKYPEKNAKALAKFRKSVVCNIIKKHAEDLKDDPERLSTEFLQKLIGVKCDKPQKN